MTQTYRIVTERKRINNPSGLREGISTGIYLDGREIDGEHKEAVARGYILKSIVKAQEQVMKEDFSVNKLETIVEAK